MSKRKNINDLFHQDRAVARGGSLVEKGLGALSAWTGGESKSAVTQFDDWKAEKHKTSSNWVKCSDNHPGIKIGEHMVYGGSCSNPLVKDADIYIGFDGSMAFTQRHWPWKKGTEILFKITDMSIPKDPEEFKKLVKWTLKQMHDGKKVHCGCIGGHGRTGMFLSALVKEEMGLDDAISYVRQHYCHKAVESAEQVKFLNEQFGITVVKGHKANGSSHSHSKAVVSSSSLTLEKERDQIVQPMKGSSIWD